MGVRLLGLAEAVYYFQGNDEEALSLIERGMALHEDAFKRDPNQGVNVISLSFMGMKGAAILLDAGRLEPARNYIDGMLGNFERIVQQLPDNPEMKAHLAQTHFLAGEWARKTGDADTALDHYTKSEQLYDTALDALVHEEWLVDQSFTFGAIGDILLAHDKKENALSYYQAGYDQLMPLLKPYAHRKWHALAKHLETQLSALQ